jgi:hypothetical protein
MSELPRPEFLDARDAARYLRVHPLTLARLIRHSEVPVQLRAGHYVVRRDDLDKRLGRGRP